MFMKCESCGYYGHEGWIQAFVAQDEQGNNYYGWECPVCGHLVCVGTDCGPDSFGQVLDNPPDGYLSPTQFDQS